MDYEASLRWLSSLIQKPRGWKKTGLRPMRELMGMLGDPEKRLKAVLVGGTSGKGSTCAMLSSILQEAGHKTGLWTKPHFNDVRERIRMNGKVVGKKGFASLAFEVRKASLKMRTRRPTYFEALVAIAILYFVKNKADIAVVEVGIGGRTDATNVLEPMVSIITNVHIEHTRLLGKTIGKIARNKAGIIREGGVLMTASSGKALSVFREECEKKKADLYVVGKGIKVKTTDNSYRGQKILYEGLTKKYDTYLPLLGDYQARNLGCAIAAIELLREKGFTIGDTSVIRGIRRVRWPGRLEVMQKDPLVVLDCAKDPQAVKALVRNIRSLSYRRLFSVISISGDKDVPEMMKRLSSITDLFIISRHAVGRKAASPGSISKEAKAHGKESIIIEDTKKAVRSALSMASPKDLVLVTGSVFTVAEARRLWKGNSCYL